MISALLVIIVSFFLNQLVLTSFKNQLRHSQGTLVSLFFYHLLFFLIYYFYAQTSASDSKQYFSNVLNDYRGENWSDFYGTGTLFIEFITYPLVKYLNFEYEGVMLLFSTFGYFGFVFFYLFLVNLLEFRHRLWGVDFILILLFLPNMHFWTASLGKGSVVFLGLGIFFYGLTNYTKRLLPLIIGGLIVFHVRSHIMMICMLAIALAVMFSSKGLKLHHKIIILSASILVLIPSINAFLAYAGLEEGPLENYEGFIEHRSSDLSKATSGINIQNYNQLEKLFAFLFRPLFFDAPGALGLFVSFENLLYLFLFLKLFSSKFIKFIIGAPWLVKAAFIAFFGISFALAQVSGNLGLAIRQKSQVMYLLFFVLLAYADWSYNQKGKVIIGE